MSPREPDDLLDQLGALPSHDVTPETAARIARIARAALADSARTPHWFAELGRFYTRVIEPPLVLGACAVYLVWAVQTLNATGFAAAGIEATAQRSAAVRYAQAEESINGALDERPDVYVLHAEFQDLIEKEQRAHRKRDGKRGSEQEKLKDMPVGIAGLYAGERIVFHY